MDHDDSQFSLTSLNIDIEVINYFASWISYANNGEIIFDYTFASQVESQELVSNNGMLVPSTNGLWLAGNYNSALVSHMFMFTSAIEALCFCSLNKFWISKPGYAIFVSFGLLPTIQQILTLPSAFPNARIHTVFGSDLTGQVLDCKIALWIKGRNAAFFFAEGEVMVNYKSATYKIPVPKLSLNHFEKLTGLRANTRTHKPLLKYASYLDQVMASRN